MSTAESFAALNDKRDEAKLLDSQANNSISMDEDDDIRIETELFEDN